MAAIGFLVDPELADQMVSVGSELPEMALIVCPTAEAARAQARASLEFGRRPYSPSEWDNFIHEEYQAGRALFFVVEEEESIEQIKTWSLIYDLAGTKTGRAYVAGSVYDVPLSVALKQVRYYKVHFTGSDGNRYEAWAQIDDEPYALKYLQDLEKGRR